MTTFRIAVILTVLAGFYGLHWMLDPNRAPVPPLIPKLVNQMLDQTGNVCVEAGPFPYDTGAPPTAWNAHIGNYATCEPVRCNRCEDLAQAGLLIKSHGSRIDESGIPQTTVRYELSDEGSALYHEDIDDREITDSKQPLCPLGETMTGKTPDNDRRPGLCFAEGMVFHAVTERLKPTKFGMNKVIGFRYVARAEAPAPFIFDPRVKALLPMVPAKPEKEGEPALYPPVTTALVMFPGEQDGELDGSIRYGKWLNEK